MFTKIGSLGRNGGPLLVDRIITNSVTASVGGAVMTASGFAALVTTGTRILGIVESIIGDNRLAVTTGGTYRGNPGDTYAAATDNQTVDMASVRVDIDMLSLYEVAGDVTLGTTAAALLDGKSFDLATSLLLDESTAGEIKQQVYSHGVSLVNPTNAVVNIVESEVFGF